MKNRNNSQGKVVLSLYSLSECVSELLEYVRTITNLAVEGAQSFQTAVDLGSDSKYEQ